MYIQQKRIYYLIHLLLFYVCFVKEEARNQTFSLFLCIAVIAVRLKRKKIIIICLCISCDCCETKKKNNRHFDFIICLCISWSNNWPHMFDIHCDCRWKQIYILFNVSISLLFLFFIHYGRKSDLIIISLAVMGKETETFSYILHSL